MNELQIKSIITDVLTLEKPNISDIRRTPGGLTNKSYFATINGEAYVVRIPGAGTDELINRHEEKANLNYGTKLGINPPLLYCDAESGIKITRKIENALTMTPERAREGNTMRQIIYLFKHLHTAQTPMKNTFKLFDLMTHYESLIRNASDIIMENIAELKQDVMSLKTIYQSLQINYVPCHIDTVTENIILGKNDELYLIDWEYSGMFDPLWDIATLLLSLDLQEDETFFFLSQYLERKPSYEETQRILMHTIFQDYLWCLWAYFKEAQGDDVGADAIKRSERASRNIIQFKKHFSEESVG